MHTFYFSFQENKDGQYGAQNCKLYWDHELINQVLSPPTKPSNFSNYKYENCSFLISFCPKTLPNKETVQRD